MKIVMYPNPSAARHWRLEGPAKYLRRKGHEAYVVDTGINEELAKWADISVLQGCVDKEGIALLHAYQQEKGKKIVVDHDDALEIDATNPHKKSHEVLDAVNVLKATLAIADLVTTTTPHLQKQLAQYNPNTVVLPNMLDLEVWNQNVMSPIPGRIRVGWAGSITHYEDLQLIRKPLLELRDKYPEVELVFIGDPRLRELFPGPRVEVMLGVPFDSWPARLAGLRLNVGLAPLQDTPFNRCKSNIKWLEYSINRIPGVYSPIVYQFRGFDGDFGMIAHNQEEWLHCTENLILHERLRDEIAAKSYAFVYHKYDLARHAKLWLDSYTSIS